MLGLFGYTLWSQKRKAMWVSPKETAKLVGFGLLVSAFASLFVALGVSWCLAWIALFTLNR